MTPTQTTTFTRTLLLGDCREQMHTLADNSIDAIVTDPPYALVGTSGTGGFMGAKWDSELPTVEMWKEALRVAKPGAHLLAFGGTRTYHRLACAIEDAGWEIRDCIMWVYGCLSEDTEILTCKGWAKIGTIQVGDKVYAYDKDTKTFRCEAVKDTFLYDYKDTAYRIQSDCTDQFVSRNHRVIVERGGVEVFEYAENLAQEHEARVPVLESLQNLLDHISVRDERASGSQQDMFAGMCRGVEAEDTKETLGRPFTEQDMSRLRKGILQASRMAEKGKNELLLGKLQKQGRVCSSSDKTQQGAPNSDNGESETDFKSKDDRRSESRMERRGDIPTPQGELCECSVCALPKGVSANGSQGRVCDGTSSCCSERNRSAPEANGGCTSHQPQSAGQQGREFDVILDEPSAQTLRGAWRTTTTLARITPVHYKGRMWCVSVPSGAIVARRNGKIFVTGNSGFPKSMDVSKAIDRSRNENHERALTFTRWLRSTSITAEQVDTATNSKMSRRLLALDDCASIATEEKFEQLRPLLPEVPEFIERLVAERTGVEWSDYAKRHVVGTRNNGCREGANTNFLQSQGDTYDQTVPYSPEAAAWNGWGTCLKPAVEPIVVARKPLEGTVAANVLKYGTGAINIDGCRVPTEEAVVVHSPARKTLLDSGHKDLGTWENTKGRFPANLIHDGSDEVLALFPDSKGQCGAVKGNEPSELTRGIYGKFSGDRTPCAPRGDSGSAARFFYCAKASRSERGEGNVHPTVKPVALMRYLVRLVTRKGGIVLDPFMGSGTTGVAAIQEGMEFVGIERDPHYYEIAKRRVLGEVQQGDIPGKKSVPKQVSPDTSQQRDGYPTDPNPIQGELF